MVLVGTIASIAVVLAIVALWQIWQSRNEWQRRCVAMESELKQLREQLSLVNRGTIGVGRRLVQIEARLQDIEQGQEYITQTTSQHQQPYTQAEQLLNSGADEVQLKENCGLSLGEAKLMQLIHGAAESNSDRVA